MENQQSRKNFCCRFFQRSRTTIPPPTPPFTQDICSIRRNMKEQRDHDEKEKISMGNPFPDFVIVHTNVCSENNKRRHDSRKSFSAIVRAQSFTSNVYLSWLTHWGETHQRKVGISAVTFRSFPNTPCCNVAGPSDSWWNSWSNSLGGALPPLPPPAVLSPSLLFQLKCAAEFPLFKDIHDLV